MDGHWCLCKKALREGAGLASFVSCLTAVLDLEGWKKDVIGLCRNGVMPLMFQEKIRKVFELRGGSGAGVLLGGAVFKESVTAFIEVLRRFAGGGLISRFMVV
jgi:hypothetical protein